ncbi:MAG: transcription-repair coupling factor, partial [Streptococcus mutans]
MGNKMNLIDLFCQNQQILDWKKNLNQKTRQLLMGLSGSTKALAIASALEEHQKILVMTSGYSEAEKLSSDLISLLGEEKVYNFLVDDAPMAEFIFSSQEKIYARLEALTFLLDDNESGILVTNISASHLFLPNPKELKSSVLELKVGQEYNLDNFVNFLIKIGYRKESQVFNQGEFSLRGDILDIFDKDSVSPYRLEFFGDEIDGIRIFDSESQTSIENLNQVSIHPANDILLADEDYLRAQKKIEEALKASQDSRLKSYLEEILQDVKKRQLHPDSRKFLSYFYDKEWTILDYLPKHTPIFFDDFQKIMERNAQFEMEAATILTEYLQSSKAVSNQKYFVNSYPDFRNYKPATFLSNFHKGLGNLKFDSLYQFNQYPMQEFFSQFPLLKDEIDRYKKAGSTVILQASSLSSLQSLHKTLQEYDIQVEYINDKEIHKNSVQLIQGNLNQG